MQRTANVPSGVPKKKYSWLFWLIIGLAGLVFFFLGIQRANYHFDTRKQEQVAPPVWKVVLLAPTKTSEPTSVATEEPKPTATAIPTAIEPSPTPAPTVSPVPSPTSLPKMEVKWETSGPFGPYMRLSAGIETIIASPDGTVRVIEAVKNSGRTSTSLDYGKTWSSRSSTTGEIELSAQSWLKNEDMTNSNGWDWQRFYEKGMLPVNVTGAIDPNNNNLLFLAISLSTDTPVGVPAMCSSRLLFSLDRGKSWREINVPSSGWETGSIIGAVATISHNGYLELYVGLAQWEHNSLLWHATIPISQLNT